MNWNQVCKDLAQCLAHMCPKSGCHNISHSHVFNPYSLNFPKSDLRPEAISLLWEGLLTSPENSGMPSPRGFSFHVVLASFLLGPFSPSSSSFCSWSPVEPQAPHPGARESRVISEVRNTTPCPELVSAEPAAPSSYVPQHSKLIAFSWQKVWCHRLFLPNPPVDWGL